MHRMVCYDAAKAYKKISLVGKERIMFRNNFLMVGKERKKKKKHPIIFPATRVGGRSPIYIYIYMYI